MNDDPPRFDNYLPEVEVDGVGGVHVTWYDRRDDSVQGADHNVYWTYSEDGTRTFFPSLRLSDSPSDLDSVSSDLGDYMGLAGDHAGIQALWVQLKNNRAQSDGRDHDIRVRRVDVEADVRVLDLSAAASVNRVQLTWKVMKPDFVWRFQVHRAFAKSGEYFLLGIVEGSSGEGGPYSFLDESVQAKDDLFYKIQTIRTDGEALWSEPVRVVVPVGPPYLSWCLTSPNPFSNVIALELDVPKEGIVEISIFDVRGAEVRSLFRGEVQPGTNRFEWDGRNTAGEPVGLGIYFLEATLGGEKAQGKLIRVSN